MTTERRFYISFAICDYMNKRESPAQQFAPYEVAMYAALLADSIKAAIENQDGAPLEEYYDALNDELENVPNEYKEEVKNLISLLDSWRVAA